MYCGWVWNCGDLRFFEFRGGLKFGVMGDECFWVWKRAKWGVVCSTWEVLVRFFDSAVFFTFCSFADFFKLISLYQRRLITLLLTLCRIHRLYRRNRVNLQLLQLLTRSRLKRCLITRSKIKRNHRFIKSLIKQIFKSILTFPLKWIHIFLTQIRIEIFILSFDSNCFCRNRADIDLVLLLIDLLKSWDLSLIYTFITVFEILDQTGFFLGISKANEIIVKRDNVVSPFSVLLIVLVLENFDVLIDLLFAIWLRSDMKFWAVLIWVFAMVVYSDLACVCFVKCWSQFLNTFIVVVIWFWAEVVFFDDLNVSFDFYDCLWDYAVLFQFVVSFIWKLRRCVWNSSS